ncbi:transcription factor E4F1-like isoform X2 [Sycon ciliatum]|uniref:transcription factor E4F1-like isoform X2 n=1 Tax=Sycon ciliatum TaxID=27933 RepID=UPI0031F67BB8
MEDRRNSGIDGSDQQTGHAQQESDADLFSYLNYPTARDPTNAQREHDILDEIIDGLPGPAVGVETSFTDIARNAGQLEDVHGPTLKSNPHITNSVQATSMLQGQYNAPYQIPKLGGNVIGGVYTSPSTSAPPMPSVRPVGSVPSLGLPSETSFPKEPSHEAMIAAATMHQEAEDAHWPTLESKPHITDSVQATSMLQGQYSTHNQIPKLDGIGGVYTSPYITAPAMPFVRPVGRFPLSFPKRPAQGAIGTQIGDQQQERWTDVVSDYSNDADMRWSQKQTRQLHNHLHGDAQLTSTAIASSAGIPFGRMGSSEKQRQDPFKEGDGNESQLEPRHDVLHQSTGSPATTTVSKQAKLSKYKTLHKCQHCPKELRSLSVLRLHEHIHTGERPYKCKTCDASFKHPSNLRAHVRIHTEERPYKCETCELSFKQRSYLRVHERIHTREGPYKCKTCRKSFTQLSILHAHERFHTLDLS